MNIGVVFSDTQTSIGGGLSYQIKLAKIIKKISGINIYYFSSDKDTINELKSQNIKAIYFNLNYFDKLIFRLKRLRFFSNLSNFIDTRLDKKFEKYDIELVYFLSPNSHSIYLENLSYIFTVWDLCHRDHPEFPEVRKHFSFENREKLFNQVLPKASKIIAESSLGKQNLVQRYNVDSDKCVILNMPVSHFDEDELNVTEDFIKNTKKKFNISNQFIFYPAQIWAHKNHVYVLDALKILIKKNQKIDFVFCGKDKGNLDNILSYAKKNSLENQIKYLNFIDKKELVALYKSSLALVMPSYFGPTNIPPLEAFRLSTSVIYPIHDTEEILFNNSIFEIKLDEPKTLVENIEKILKKDPIIEIKKQNGLKYLSNHNDELLRNNLNQIFHDFEKKMKTWK
tara:strand:- start:168 stop:1358 length:1191 start_codon:yes stop_codon:yes gene_type:complete